jgi:hypothetical protein
MWVEEVSKGKGWQNPILHICGRSGLILDVHFASRSVQPLLYNAESPFSTVFYLVQKTPPIHPQLALKSLLLLVLLLP